MKLTIVTINYNGSDNTLKLVRSLSNQIDKDFSVIVVDNASEEADFNQLKRGVGESILVKNSENLGFSGGNNVGIRIALENGSDWVFLLNNDTWVDGDFIGGLKAVLGARKGILGVALDEGDHTAYAGRVLWLKPHGYHIYSKKKAETTKDKYIIGGAMAIHKDVFKKIGFLDEKYFLYFEDQDFSLRARKSGFPLSFTDKIAVQHHEVSSTTKKLGDPLLLYYHYRNALYFNNKNGPIYIKILNWFWLQMIIKKQLVKIIFSMEKEKSKAILEGAYDYMKGNMGKKSI